MRKTIIVAATLAIFGFGSQAGAETITLKFAAWGPPKGPMNQKTTAWARMVTKDSGGLIKVKVYWNTLGNALTVYDNVKNGVADAAWVLQPLVRGKFPKTSVVELPGLFKSSETAAVALWKLYKSGVIADEYAEIKPIAIVPMTGNRIHTNRPIPDIQALAGKKYRVAGKTLADVVSAFGGTGIQLAWTKIYQSLNKGVIQGTLSPWNDFVPAKFPEVTKYHLDHSFGMIAGMVVMNKKSYQRLSAKAKAIIDRNSYLKLTTWLGRAADNNAAENRAKVAAMKGQTIFKFSDAEFAKLRSMMAPVYADWKKRTPGGAAVLKALGK